MRGREQGQIFPLLAGILVVALALGLLLFQVARAGVLRSRAQTAADAAALAGVRNAKQQLEAMSANGGVADVGLIQDPPVRAAASLYAAKNGGRIVGYERRGVDVKIRVKTVAELGEDAEPVRQADLKGAARARARIEVTSDPVDGLAGASGGGSSSGSGSGRISDAEWKRFGEDELDGKPPTCEDATGANDVVKLGRFLQDKGFQVGENSAFGGVAPVHTDGSYHYRCGMAGALDVNFDGRSPSEKAAIDPLIDQLHELGYRTIWQAAGHFDHLHVDSGTGNIGAGGGLGGFGFGDQVMEIRLIDWDAAFETFNPYPSDGTGTATAGNPDPAVMRIMCSVLDSRGASARVRLATFETAIVESGVRNLTYGDRTSVGVFQQQQWWGTFQQRTNVAYATNKFLDGNGPPGALALDRRWSGSTGALAQAVQVSAFPDRYDGVRGQAASLHNRYCGGESISPND